MATDQSSDYNRCLGHQETPAEHVLLNIHPLKTRKVREKAKISNRYKHLNGSFANR